MTGAHPDAHPDPDAVLAQGPTWPAPDRHTLRAVVEVDLAAEAGVAIDAAHAVVTDLADRAFGHGWQLAYGAALDAEGVGPDGAAALLADDRLAGRVLDRLLARVREDGTAPGPAGDDHGWSAFPPGVSAGRALFRRAVRRRRQTARLAAVLPPRHRVAGRRRRDR